MSMFPDPASDHAVRVQKARYTPDYWFYTLYDGEGRDVLTGNLSLPSKRVTAEQVARIVFILELEYTDAR